MRYVAGESFHAKKCAFIGITFLTAGENSKAKKNLKF